SLCVYLVRTEVFKRLGFGYLFCMVHFCLPSSSITFFSYSILLKLHYAHFQQSLKLFFCD
uniref:Uncharacterized protein n=1 Tax=Sciurus vulgaris TaxID=55149 RepID=A0A8D2DYE6_SCIVU